MTSQVAFDVFASHNRKDKPWVRRLVAFLRAYNLRVFFDEDSMMPGESVVLGIERGLTGSRDVLLILSASSLASKWVGMEISVASYQEIDDATRRLVPVSIDKIDASRLPSYVRTKNIVDLADDSQRERRLRSFLEYIGVTEAPLLPRSKLRQLIELGDTELRLATKSNVEEWGWTGEYLLDRLLAIDYELMQDLNEGHAGTSPQWAPLFTTDANTWRVLVNEKNEVGGYWHFAPLFASEFELAKKGALLDSHITLDRVAPISDVPGIYNAYIVAVCMRNVYRTPLNMKKLFSSFIESLEVLASGGSFIREVVANAFTDDGIRLCKAFGMELLCNHQERGLVYSAPINRFLDHPIGLSFPELRRMYSEVGLMFGGQVNDSGRALLQ